MIMIQDQGRWTHLEQAELTIEVLTVEEVTEMVVEVGLTDLQGQTSLLEHYNGLRSRLYQCAVAGNRKTNNIFKIYSKRSIRTSSKRAATLWGSWWDHQGGDQAGQINKVQVEVMVLIRMLWVDLYYLVLEML